MDMIVLLGKRLRIRQEIIATATVYFKRFYINNTFYDIDPYLMLSTCVYLACKVDECPHHIKQVWAESKAVFAELSSDIRFLYDVSDIAECESYLLEEMKFYLVVYHPYQVLIDIADKVPMTKPSLQATCEAQQWYADLNVEITDVLQVVNDLLALYEYWKDYSEPNMPDMVSKYIADIAASL
ncbi:RNA polymerase II holoenzyme cyclin-like subunit [Coemansia sp. RSA 1365]|nr:RNA polymerase II holoenzyme cyclin-like subunit [Coemansia sp. RSA 1365]